MEQKFPLAQNDPQARAALDAAIRAQGGVLKVRLMYVGDPSRAIKPKPIQSSNPQNPAPNHRCRGKSS